MAGRRSKNLSVVLFAFVFVAASCVDKPVYPEQCGSLKGKVIFSPAGPEAMGEVKRKVPRSWYKKIKVVVREAQGKKPVASTWPDENGNYSLELRGGRYVLEITGEGISFPCFMRGPLRHVIVIRKGQTTVFDIHIDTGIR